MKITLYREFGLDFTPPNVKSLLAVLLRVISVKRVKLTPVESARIKLGVEDKEGEELITALIQAYGQNWIVDVYTILLNVEVDYRSFYKLQAEAWSLARNRKELCALCEAERMVRAIALMASMKVK